MTQFPPNVIVLKFGGSSLKDIDCIEKVVSVIRDKIENGYKVVAVVSAQGKITEVLLKDADIYAPFGNPREIDMLLTTGERASAAFVAMALSSKGFPAISLTGSQAGIITDDNHTNARIIEIRPDRVLNALKDGMTVIVGGFQGVSFKKEVTTLGRGGSDTTAVALAAALNAEVCEIFSDVDGVYTADPNIVKDACRIDEMSYQEMQELSEAGTKVLHSRAVEFAKAKGIEIHCKSTFEPDNPGTVIRGFETREKVKAAGVAFEKNISLVHIYDKNADALETIDEVLKLCIKDGVSVKQVSFHKGYKASMVGSFILSMSESYPGEYFILKLKEKFSLTVETHQNLSAVSVVGEGITDRPDNLFESMKLLKENHINVAGFHTSSFRISLLVPSEKLEKSVKLLHKYFAG
ncbi:MAG TPA: aspartate kinase [bacterium]|nr:aspartate kinase [bacterium]